jgi:hypothetical protein
MEMPEFFQGQSITRFMQGAAAGAIVTVGVGFIWGGWVTDGTANKLTSDAVEATKVAIYAPVCVERYMAHATDAQRAMFAKANTWNRDTFIEKAGFATLPGSSAPSDAVADACAATLSKQLKADADEQAKKS